MPMSQSPSVSISNIGSPPSTSLIGSQRYKTPQTGMGRVQGRSLHSKGEFELLKRHATYGTMVMLLLLEEEEKKNGHGCRRRRRCY
jgi:hypothetical protein